MWAETHQHDVCISLKSLILLDFFSSNVGLSNEMMGLIGAGNNPMVGMTVAVAVAIEEASK